MLRTLALIIFVLPTPRRVQRSNYSRSDPPSGLALYFQPIRVIRFFCNFTHCEAKPFFDFSVCAFAWGLVSDFFRPI